MKNFIAYYRVSTQRQGDSGLGLEDQLKIVREYVASVGGKIVDSRTEIESGTIDERPKLQEALALAKSRKNPCTLIVAKLDRLARDNHFVSGLLKSHADFVACDYPQAGPLVLQIMSAVAEEEARLISVRTKAALAARKARGLPLGNPAFKAGVISPMGQELKDKAKAEAERLRPVIESFKSQGITTVRGLTEALNSKGYKTATGANYLPMTVSRILSRLAA